MTGGLHVLAERVPLAAQRLVGPELLLPSRHAPLQGAPAQQPAGHEILQVRP